MFSAAKRTAKTWTISVPGVADERNLAVSAFNLVRNMVWFKANKLFQSLSIRCCVGLCFGFDVPMTARLKKYFELCYKKISELAIIGICCTAPLWPSGHNGVFFFEKSLEN